MEMSTCFSAPCSTSNASSPDLCQRDAIRVVHGVHLIHFPSLSRRQASKSLAWSITYTAVVTSLVFMSEISESSCHLSTLGLTVGSVALLHENYQRAQLRVSSCPDSEWANVWVARIRKIVVQGGPVRTGVLFSYVHLRCTDTVC